MKQTGRLWGMILLWICLGYVFAKGQVVHKDFLSKDHSGSIESSINFPGQKLGYHLRYDRTEGARIHYDLDLLVGGKKRGTFRVLMRNLIVTYYLDISFPKDGALRTMTAIFDKGNKWVRVKFAPQEGCRRNAAACEGRLNEVKSYDQLLNFVIQMLDQGTDLNCYLQED